MEIYDPHSDDGKDYVLQIKVRNGPLLRAMRLRGYRAVTLAEAAKISYTTLNLYLALKLAPITRKGWRRSAIALAKCLGLPPDALFPEQHLEHALAKASGEMEVSREEMVALFEAPEDNAESRLIAAQVSEKVDEIINTLTPREKQVLEWHLGLGDEGPLTLDAIGERLHLSRERIRQIICNGMRTFTQPKHYRALAKAGSSLAMDYIDRHGFSKQFMFETPPRLPSPPPEKEPQKIVGGFHSNNEKLNEWSREVAERNKQIRERKRVFDAQQAKAGKVATT